MLDKLERKFGKYAIKNLMRYIIVLYAIGFFLSWIMPEGLLCLLLSGCRADSPRRDLEDLYFSIKFPQQ